MSNPSFKVDVRLDRRMAWFRGASVRYLVFRFLGGKAEKPAARPPHNLSIVIDSSESMAGRPIENAKLLASALIARLEESDRVSLVSFAGQPEVIFRNHPMGDSGKREALREVEKIQLSSGSNLSSGWLEGAELVAAGMEEGESHHRVVVLSDGLPGEDTLAPEILAEQARQLRSKGLFTTGVGVGFAPNPPHIAAIDDEACSDHAVAKWWGSTIDLLAARSLELAPSVAEDMTLRFDVPEAVEIEPISELPPCGPHEKNCWCIGPLCSREARYVVVKVRLPGGEVGERIPLKAKLDWTDSKTGSTQVGPEIHETITFATGRQNTPQTRDHHASLIVAATWQSMIIRRLIEFNRTGHYREADSFIQKEMKFLERYCHGLKIPPALMDILGGNLLVAHRPWRESTIAESRRQALFLHSGRS